MTVVVDLAAAVICFANACYPALVGPRTPTGEFQIQQRITSAAGYGGDVLQFHETDAYVVAIHRVWVLKPSEQRMSRLTSGDPDRRRSITNGCVNVMPEVYQKLLDCCADSKLIVK